MNKHDLQYFVVGKSSKDIACLDEEEMKMYE